MAGSSSASPTRRCNATAWLGRYATAVSYGLVMALAFFCYWRTWSFGFVFVDDDRLIVDQGPELLSADACYRSFTRSYFRRGAPDHSFYRPLVTCSYAIDARLNATNPHGYHRTNALLHVAVTALLLYWLRTRGSRTGSEVLAASVFAIHPMTTEAVAWIAGRPDLLMTAFALLCWTFHGRAVRHRSTTAEVMHHSTWLLALLSKEAAIVVPVVLLLEARLVTRLCWRDAAPLRRLLGWAIVLMIYLLARATALRDAPGLAYLGLHSEVVSNLVTNAPTLVTNLGKLLLPIQLSVLATARDTWFWPGLLGIMVGLVLWKRGIACQSIASATLGYGLLMLPSLLASPKLMLENRLYLPMMPVLGLIAPLIDTLGWNRQRLVLGSVPVVIVLAMGNSKYLESFRNRLSFAAAAVRGSPHLALAHKNMALAEHAAGRLERAEREYRTALALDPEEPMAHGNLGAIMGAKRRFAEAEREFRQELLINPDYAPAHHNLAALLQARGLYDEAAAHWESSLQGQRNDATAARYLYAYYSARHDARALLYRQLLETLTVQATKPSGAPVQ